jgi:hypothetical protein
MIDGIWIALSILPDTPLSSPHYLFSLAETFLYGVDKAILLQLKKICKQAKKAVNRAMIEVQKITPHSGRI